MAIVSKPQAMIFRAFNLNHTDEPCFIEILKNYFIFFTFAEIVSNMMEGIIFEIDGDDAVICDRDEAKLPVSHHAERS